MAELPEDSVLRTLSVETKALVVFNEFAEGGQPADLAAMLDELTAEPSERDEVVARVEAMLNERRYPPEAVKSLVERLKAGGRKAAPPEQSVEATRSLRPTARIPFGGFKVPEKAPAKAPEKGAGGPYFGESPRLKAEEVIAPRTKGAKRVLIADDDKRIRLLYKIRLEKSGYTVVEAAEGQDAWKKLSSGQVDAAIIDMKMPGYHGLEILSRMVDSGVLLPVVICTAYDQLADEFVVATYPHLRYLVKPAAPEDVLAALEEVIRESEA